MTTFVPMADAHLPDVRRRNEYAGGDTVATRIESFVCRHGPVTLSEINRCVPGTTVGTIRVTLTDLVRARRICRLAPGLYDRP